MGRTPIGDVVMTPAERVRCCRAKARALREIANARANPNNGHGMAADAGSSTSAAKLAQSGKGQDDMASHSSLVGDHGVKGIPRLVFNRQQWL